ncbi:Putative prophage protein [Lactiplantibacillus plantarum]|nr:hypothetical protein [Lactiplantibacillus plantarum]VDH12552.1 Putative prophage protein [Lactiplantibacillus plantarum]
MIKVYRKTATIKAEQFDGSDEMVDKYELIDAGTMLGTHHSPELYLTGSGKLNVGDWIATGVNGEHWSIADDVFKKTYAELPVINKGIAHLIELTKQDGKSLGDMFVDYAPKQLTDADEDMISNWVHDTKNKTVLSNKLARAWLDGFQVEEDK